ncbi:PolI-like DNA polymerase [Musa troglodytarum]|uniref:PolI-like DNA polymerase n=1 Tax=Musa troglodytarum TaxID=320322 RepID=A0A9E7HI74_9LILI|nr:PolI-like DNA polymerase [Musa troglodytarum]
MRSEGGGRRRKKMEQWRRRKKGKKRRMRKKKEEEEKRTACTRDKQRRTAGGIPPHGMDPEWVWHNYSFDSHVLGNCDIKLSGFHADTMHLARLFDSSRRANGGYSLEALTNDRKIMSSDDELKMGKITMKSIFGKRKLKKDGSEGKLITLAPVDVLQREERISWICYSALDSISTFKLFDNLKAKLELEPWTLDDTPRGTMYDFYEEYWRPFCVLLVQMESEGMLVDRSYLSEIEKLAITEKQIASDKFRKWASKHCPDAKYMNVGSDAQIRQLFFGDTLRNNTNKCENDQDKCLSKPKSFKVPNTENVIENGRKSPSKYRTIVLNKICEELQTDMYTDSGLPSVSGDALKVFAGKVSNNQNFLIDDASYQSGSDEEVNNNHDSTKEMTEMSHVLTHDEDTSDYGTAYKAFGEGKEGRAACQAIAALCDICSIDSLISNFILPLQGNHISGVHGRIHCSLNINTETGRLSARRPNLQNQPALEKDRYKIRQAFVAGPGNSLIVADYGQLELRILAHLANCKSMLEAFRAGGDFHSRTAMNMYSHVREAVEKKRVLLEWHPQQGEDKPPVPLLKDAFGSERRKAKMLNFSIAYGKTPVGLSRDWKVSVKEAKDTVSLWYKERQEVLCWQEECKKEALKNKFVRTLLGRSRHFPLVETASNAQRRHIERAAINTPVQGSAADVAMCAMLEIDRNIRLKELGWKLLLQVHDEVILEGPTESAELAKAIVVECMSKPFYGTNFLNVDLVVDAKCAQNWYAAK